MHVASAEAWPEEAQQHISKALEASELALSIDASHGPSLVTRAEVHAAAAKLARSCGAGAKAPEHFAAACQDYEAALRRPTALGSCSERCTVRYNYACVLAQCGRLEGAVQVLVFAVRKDRSALSDAVSDADLDALRGVPECSALLQSLRESSGV